MNSTTTQSKDTYAATDGMPAGATLLSTASITGDEVRNRQNENLGKIEDIMLDITSGKIRYAVLASGGFLGLGDRLFAIPWNALTLDKENQRFILDVDVDRLKNAPGFDKDQWPNMADASWNSSTTPGNQFTRRLNGGGSG